MVNKVNNFKPIYKNEVVNRQRAIAIGLNI